MPPGFVTVPERDAYWLASASVPATLLADLPPGVPVDDDGLVRVDGMIRDSRIVAVVPAGGADGPEPRVDLARGQLWPCLIDVHTHLDKAHTCERAPNADGTFASALRTVAADRSTRWSAEDVRRRIDFGLRCSWAHGTRAIRTHIDSMGPQAAISWPVFEQVRTEWAGRTARGGMGDARSTRRGRHQRGGPADVQPLSARSSPRPHAALARRHAPARIRGASRARRRGERQLSRRVLRLRRP